MSHKITNIIQNRVCWPSYTRFHKVSSSGDYYIIIMSLQSLVILRLFFSSFLTEQIFTGWGNIPTPNLQRGRPVYPFFVWAIAFGLSCRIGPTSIYTNDSIALRNIWTTQDQPLCQSWVNFRGTVLPADRNAEHVTKSRQRPTTIKNTCMHILLSNQSWTFWIFPRMLRSHTQKKKTYLLSTQSNPTEDFMLCKRYDFARLALTIQ